MSKDITMRYSSLSFISPVILLLTIGCAADQDSLQPDVNELYTRAFISEFGVAAKGHDFSMATSAGLKVTTSRGGHVIVTAEVDGKEYLFANLDVPAGTHPLPVTIPRSVTTLKVATTTCTYYVDPNATLDIDQATPASRGGSYTMATGSNGISYATVKHTAQCSENVADSPVLVFDPSEVLTKYFESHPLGADNTDYDF